MSRWSWGLAAEGGGGGDDDEAEKLESRSPLPLRLNRLALLPALSPLLLLVPFPCDSVEFDDKGLNNVPEPGRLVENTADASMLHC